MTDAHQPPENVSADTAQQDAANSTADPAEALVRENGEMKDRLLRTLAEMENLRRRTLSATPSASRANPVTA